MDFFARLLALLLCCTLAACSADNEDIQSWMAEQERGMTGGIRPLPEMKTFPSVAYDAESSVDPFSTSRIEPAARAQTVGGPDLNRRREPLEAYPLESLSMVGVLMQGEIVQALISVDKVLHQVRVGNYMGLDHGVVTGITETEVTLKELVEDINGDWVERTSSLLLQEQ
ncbi:MAG: pilus assembly protein PilP [Rhodocyclaceae bacterium]|nr:pilus assembly protein PilP [Rhodocyclaceae bacterium]